MKKITFPFTKILSQLFIAKFLLAAFLVLLVINHLSAQTSGINPPELIDFSFTPTAIDTANSSRNVTITVHAKDANEGVRFVSVDFHRTGDDFIFGVSMESSRISGDDKDGVYRQVFTFSPNTPSGMYNAAISLSDRLGNFRYFNAAELTELGFATQLQVNKPLLTPISISGRVRTTNGRGVSKALVTLTDTNGNVLYATTNPFGYYRFNQVKDFDTYIQKVKHKSYSFSPRIYFIAGGRIHQDFYANP